MPLTRRTKRVCFRKARDIKLWVFGILGLRDVRGRCERFYVFRLNRSKKTVVPFKEIESGVYGDLILIFPKPYSIYLKGTIALK